MSNSASDPIGNYCDYLDKEMTIMGLLTAFAVAVPSFVLDRAVGAKLDDKTTVGLIWCLDKPMVIGGCMAFFIAALFFYLQRSMLAFYIGQLRFSCTEARYRDWPSKTLLEEADSWATWIHYNTGFAFTALGAALLASGIIAPDFSHTVQYWRLGLLTAVTLTYVSVNWYVRATYSLEDHPWQAFRERPKFPRNP